MHPVFSCTSEDTWNKVIGAFNHHFLEYLAVGVKGFKQDFGENLLFTFDSPEAAYVFKGFIKGKQLRGVIELTGHEKGIASQLLA